MSQFLSTFEVFNFTYKVFLVTFFVSKYWKHEFIWGAHEWAENAPKGMDETVTMDTYIKVGGHFSPVDLYWGQTLTVLLWFGAILLAMVPIDFPVADSFFTFSVEAELTLETVTVSQWSCCWSLSLLCRLLLSLLWCLRSTFDLYSCSSRGHHLY